MEIGFDKKDAPPLTEEDKRDVFRIATKGLTRRYSDAMTQGMTDDTLAKALAEILGEFGGSGGPDCLSVCHMGAGLRIWGGWHIVNHNRDKPLFAGRQTIAMARELYGIRNPDDAQGTLL